MTVIAGLGTLANGIVTLTKAQQRQQLFTTSGGEFERERLIYLQGVGQYAEPDPEKRLGLFSMWLANKAAESSKKYDVLMFSGK